MTFKDQGMPNVSAAAVAAAFHVRLVVDVPKRLSKDQKKLVEQLGQDHAVDKLEPRAADDDRTSRSSRR